MSDPKAKLSAIALANLLRSQMENRDQRLEFYAAAALEIKDKFDALVEKGFDHQQAIQLLIGKAL